MDSEKAPVAALADKRTGMRPGQDLVAAGYTGLKGTTVLAVRKEEELLKRYTRQFVTHCQNLSELFPTPDAKTLSDAGAADWEYCGEGGIMAALWKLFAEYGLGFELELRALPILQETVEVCELFGLNPYRLEAGGCVLVAADNGGDAVRRLKQKGIHGVVVGKVTAGIGRQLVNGEIRSFLDRPKPDELYKI